MPVQGKRSEMTEGTRRRKTTRNRGQLFGRLDGLLPFLYLAKLGARWSELHGVKSDSRPGLFVVGEHDGEARPGVVVRVGLILPVSSCRNPTTRSTLTALPGLINGLGHLPLSEQRRIAQAKLDDAFGGALLIDRRDLLSPYLTLRPTPAFFERLRLEFDYVVEVLDDPDGAVSVTRSTPFAWRSLGELMEWYHAPDERWPGCWSPFTPFLVSGGTGLVKDSFTEWRAGAVMNRPAEAPARWFVLRPGLPDAMVTFRFEMLDHGWARLHVAVGEDLATIRLSEVYNPFPRLVEWGSRIDAGDLPIEIEIDEEGEQALLTVLGTEDLDRVLFRVSRMYTEEYLLEGIVSRTDLAGALKSELRRFFGSEFDAARWEAPYRRGDEEFIPTKTIVNDHPWMASTP